MNGMQSLLGHPLRESRECEFGVKNRQKPPLSAGPFSDRSAAASGARGGRAVRRTAADLMGGQRVTRKRTVHGEKICRAAAHPRER